MSANDRQEGGTHYMQPEGVPQHWDLSIMYQWDGFQHTITKYVMRWKTKHPTPEKKLEDLKKALHTLEKYIENYEKFLQKPEVKFVSVAPVQSGQMVSTLGEFEKRATAYLQDADMRKEGGWGDGMLLYTCLHCKEPVKGKGLEAVKAKHMGQCAHWPVKQPSSTPGAAPATASEPVAPAPAPAAAPAAPLESIVEEIAPARGQMRLNPRETS